ncbi:3,4-dehydroadipyl-CoA semialdehyde dehydrogenase [Georgfuchsia toluolica]|uniref:3,4-dehydroadipyl-CoA semialdehyde dehydrogenase n=1 Tax=Georgfuchsia toluolica TaxID=424218 RepID=UPI001C73D78C|nr:3,4-dehydroadipyl-CoA semialdehyde dehydrogenase [Georgfuchsia toluolica]
MKLANYICSRWQNGSAPDIALTDPVTNEILATASSNGIDIASGLNYARTVGGTALRTLSYAERAELLGRIAELFATKRGEYFDISQKNSGATEGDASFDVDGAIYTIKTFARAGKTLGNARYLIDGATIPLAKTDVFQGQHYMVPLSGAAIFINAFNFPAWGLWEKAAPALLAGMPVFVKPATPTAWLAQRMVADVVEAGILPPGALSIICGSARDVLDHVQECDVVSFTGSAGVAAHVRAHPVVIANSVRVNIEADSVNSAILGPDGTQDTPVFNLLVKEVVREMTIKTGQKCTAIRRIMVPKAIATRLGEAIAAGLADYTVGNPRNPAVRVGPLVSTTQRDDALAGLARLKSECTVLFGGDSNFMSVDAEGSTAFLQPTLLYCDRGLAAEHVHDIEVFGPVATIVPYTDTAEAIAIIRRGKGSLVASVFSDDIDFTGTVTLGIADLHGRILVVDNAVGSGHTGHGNVVPTCLHGGGGRAGGGEELGGLRGLAFYHRRMVLQGPKTLIDAFKANGVDAVLLNA